MSRAWMLMTLLVAGLAAPALADPNETVLQADQVLAEIMCIPAKAIPERLLAEAQGVAIIPNVIKIGFIAGARRGHGVVLVRDNEGEWSLPQFVTLTGGSIGWQAGVQGSDVVLVFTTKRGVQNLLRGQFTIGADVAAAAGPIGRDAAAATDATLRAEILSYSRSRGLFLGVSLDGSALEVDNAAHMMFYGSPTSQIPLQIPQSAARLRSDLISLTPDLTMLAAQRGAVPAGAVPAGAVAVGPAPPPAMPPRRFNPRRYEALRASLDQNSRGLQAILTPEWQSYLALPKEIYAPGQQPPVEALRQVIARFDQVPRSPQYASLASRPEFQSTLELLREYTEETAAAGSAALALPPPPR